MGPLTREELAIEVAKADICLAPLRADIRNRNQGCSPIKLFEYMSAGRAVLSTDLPCVTEILENGETGMLVRPSRPKALSEGIVELLDSEDQRSSLGRAARERILANGTWTHRREQLRSFYRRLTS